MILEGIVTTLAPSGALNIAPMGPCVDAAMRYFILRPYRTTQTYQNLCQHLEGVLHVTDDVLLLARAAVGDTEPPPETFPATIVRGQVLRDACRYYEFRVVRIDDRRERSELQAEVVHMDRLRDFFGFNRAKHAVVEAAILATRLEFLPADEIQGEYRRLAVLVEKTGGERERQAFAFLEDHVHRARAAALKPASRP